MWGAVKKFFKSYKGSAILEGYAMAFGLFPEPNYKLYEDDPIKAIDEAFRSVASEMREAIETFDTQRSCKK